MKPNLSSNPPSSRATNGEFGAHTLLLRAGICFVALFLLATVTRADTFTGVANSSYLYSSIPVVAGNNLDITLTSPDLGPSQGTELLLFDGQGNLVAVAAGNGNNGSSVLTYTPTTGGDWTVAVTNNGSGTYNFNLGINGYSGTGMPVLEQAFSGQTSPATQQFTDVLIPTNGGDTLNLNATSPDLASGDTTGLLLFDNNGNLVAVAAGDGPNGSSLLNYQVPGGDAGLWTAEVEDLSSTAYNYNLSVYGETAGDPYLEYPTTTTTTTPEPGSFGLVLLGLAVFSFCVKRFAGREFRSVAEA